MESNNSLCASQELHSCHNYMSYTISTPFK